jgi:hypothetical protein
VISLCEGETMPLEFERAKVATIGSSDEGYIQPRLSSAY